VAVALNVNYYNIVIFCQYYVFSADVNISMWSSKLLCMLIMLSYYCWNFLYNCM